MNEYTTDDYRFRTYRNPDGEQHYEISQRSDGEVIDDDLFDGDTLGFAQFVDGWLDADPSADALLPPGRCRQRSGRRSQQAVVLADIEQPRSDPPALDGVGEIGDDILESVDGTLYFRGDPRFCEEEPTVLTLGQRVLKEISDRPIDERRLRRRDLVLIVMEECGLDRPDVRHLLHGIQLIVTAGDRNEERVILPKVGVARTFRTLGLWLEWELVRARPLVDHDDDLAQLLRLPVDVVRHALEVIVEVIEAWPDDLCVFIPGFGPLGDDQALEYCRREYVLEEIERIERRGELDRGVWMIQVDAEAWELLDEDEKAGVFPDALPVGPGGDEMAMGDIVVFSVDDGCNGGGRIHGIGEVVGHMADPDHPGWTWVLLDFAIDLARHPVRDDQRLERLLPDRLDPRTGGTDFEISQLPADALARILQLTRLHRAFVI